MTTESGVFYEHRREQTVNWVHDMVNEHLRARFCKHPEIVRIMPDVEKAVAEGSLPAVAAVRKLISSFHGVQS